MLFLTRAHIYEELVVSGHSLVFSSRGVMYMYLRHCCLVCLPHPSIINDKRHKGVCLFLFSLLFSVLDMLCKKCGSAKEVFPAQ